MPALNHGLALYVATVLSLSFLKYNDNEYIAYFIEQLKTLRMCVKYPRRHWHILNFEENRLLTVISNRNHLQEIARL